jgi:hypothetical protein
MVQRRSHFNNAGLLFSLFRATGVFRGITMF